MTPDTTEQGRPSAFMAVPPKEEEEVSFPEAAAAKSGVRMKLQLENIE